jgi:hypothetical protein
VFGDPAKANKGKFHAFVVFWRDLIRRGSDSIRTKKQSSLTD